MILSWPVLAFVASGLTLLMTIGAPSRLRADDTVRRTQEELRKRNLYFGNIDGTLNQGTVGALRRYQERKGFAVTGEPDVPTLRSLSIPTPDQGEADAPLEPDPWPEMPVLRSDLAHRPPPLTSGTVVADDGPSADDDIIPPKADASASATNVATATAAAAASAPPPTRSPASPNDGAARGKSDDERLSPETVRAFLEGYLRDAATNNLDAEMAYYGDEVDYFNRGVTSREDIARDVRAYYRRWPERRYEIVGPVTVTPSPQPDETSVRFQLRFSCRGKSRGGGGKEAPPHAEGRTDNLFVLRSIRPGEIHIVGLKEQRVRS